jgi:hypothetical protein
MTTANTVPTEFAACTRKLGRVEGGIRPDKSVSIAECYERPASATFAQP